MPLSTVYIETKTDGWISSSPWNKAMKRTMTPQRKLKICNIWQLR